MKKTLLILVFSFFTVQVAQASTVIWNVQFFNDADIQVGEGSFSYDPSIVDTYTYPSHDEFMCDAEGNSCHFETIENTYQTNYSFSSLDFNIHGTEWSDSTEGFLWWNGSANFYGGAGRYGGYDFQPQPGFFFLGENYLGVYYLILGFDDSNPEGISTTSGSWVQQVSGFVAPTDGRWVANSTSAVPIPGAFLLLSSGFISLMVFRIKKHGKNT